MKRMAQFAAVMVVALLAGLPAAEVLTCPLRASGESTVCPESMSKATSECPMAQWLAAKKCGRDCCNCGLPKLVGPVSVTVLQKPAAPVQFVALDASGRDVDHAVAATPDGPTISSSPPRYILNCVFRI
jgi:hypothetical protein